MLLRLADEVGGGSGTERKAGSIRVWWRVSLVFHERVILPDLAFLRFLPYTGGSNPRVSNMSQSRVATVRRRRGDNQPSGGTGGWGCHVFCRSQETHRRQHSGARFHHTVSETS